MLNIRPPNPLLSYTVGGIFASRCKITCWAMIKICVPFMYIHNSEWIFGASTFPIKQKVFCSWLQEAENLSSQQGKGWEMQTLKNPGSFFLCCSFSCCSSWRFLVSLSVMERLVCRWSTMADNLVSRASVRVGIPCSIKRYQLVNMLQTNPFLL